MSFNNQKSVLAVFILAATPAAASPVISGLVDSKLKSELKGMVLAEEMNCVACHQSDESFAENSKKAPRLANIGFFGQGNPYHQSTYRFPPLHQTGVAP